MLYVVAILGLALLMIVHEAGHYFAARASGLRVTKFSIGFGPTFFRIEPHGGHWTFVSFGDRVKFKLWKHDPEKHGPTVFQVAMIPFLAYVQIAGLNPLEDIDPRDKGSYANAGLFARVVTIFAGPAANYVFASVFFFMPFYFDGKMVAGEPTQVLVVDATPAQAAGIKDGDQIVEVKGKAVSTWAEMSAEISSSPNEAIDLVVLREGVRTPLSVTPKPTGENGQGRIGVSGYYTKQDTTVGEAALLALKQPPKVVQMALGGIVELVRGKSDAKLGGPVEIVKQIKKTAEIGWAEFVFMLGSLSAYLAAFNLLPIPALDGGRLMFLGYEATTRKRANPTVEAHIHAIGLVMMLGLMIYVTFANDLGFSGSK
jgi:regulator of sigma E protease